MSVQLGTMFIYDGGNGMFISDRCSGRRDRFDLSPEQVQALRPHAQIVRTPRLTSWPVGESGAALLDDILGDVWRTPA